MFPSTPPRWLRTLTFAAACVTAGVMLGGGIVLSVALDKAPARAATVQYVPVQAPCPRPRTPIWRDHNGRYDT